ncbi:GntR family transcriptional regulator [Actinoplanes sp. HUAS TT8]|uniref:GntR family transcriptional regulator n=1 Tax=Actinoplanes sp. HUAS TT8 TaxID=3447453 RepID=UPI003F524456
MSGPIRRSVLSDDVHESLRSMILEHQLAPEERVNIDALARSLDVSPTPVREALARLESEGLVRKRPLAGYTVAPLLTRAEFNDMFDMRLVLETAAARWAASRSPAAVRESLSAEASISYVVSSSHAAFTAADARFHDLVAEAADNPLLRDAISRLHAHLHIHRLYFPYAETGSTRREHELVAVAIGAGDASSAEEAMREHLSAARARHLAVFD